MNLHYDESNKITDNYVLTYRLITNHILRVIDKQSLKIKWDNAG